MSKKTVATIIETGNHYCIAVKGNQPTLQKQVIQTTLCNAPIDTYKKKETNRGRKENREVAVYDNVDLIGEEWIGVQRIIHVHRYGWRKDKKKPFYDEHHYYILSKQIDDATIIAQGIRGYWKIENCLHYVKDVVQNEDNNGIYSGNAPEILAVLKDFVINIFRLNGFRSLKKANIKFANKIKSMIDIIKNVNLKNNRTD